MLNPDEQERIIENLDRLQPENTKQLIVVHTKLNHMYLWALIGNILNLVLLAVVLRAVWGMHWVSGCAISVMISTVFNAARNLHSVRYGRAFIREASKQISS